MKKFICDHCGKVITNKNDYIDYEIEFEQIVYPCDLCAKCFDEIVDNTTKTIEKFIGGDK